IASDGLTRVDIPSGADWQVGGTWDGSAYSDPPGHADKVQAARAEGVNAERERRILAGKVFPITGYGSTIHPSGDDKTQTVLLALKDSARDLQAANVTDAVLPFRDMDNITHNLTASQAMELVNLGKAWVTDLYEASWDLKATDPIPANYADDKHWP
ncbi:hypothetical protein, partial [Pseudohoeflea coraliihabitans]